MKKCIHIPVTFASNYQLLNVMGEDKDRAVSPYRTVGPDRDILEISLFKCKKSLFHSKDYSSFTF